MVGLRVKNDWTESMNRVCRVVWPEWRIRVCVSVSQHEKCMHGLSGIHGKGYIWRLNVCMTDWTGPRGERVSVLLILHVVWKSTVYERMWWIFKYGWQLRFFFISGSRGWSGPGSETGIFCGHVCRLGGADWSRLWLRFFFVSELGGSYIVGFGFCWPCVAVPALLRLMTLRGRTGVWLCLFNYFWPCVATLIFWWTSDPVWQNAHLILVCLITFGPVWQRWFVGGLLTLCGRSWLLIVPDPTWQCILVNYLMALCGNLDFVWLSPVPTGNPCII